MIQKAQTKEHRILTDISFASKRYWNYPAEYYEIWNDELTIDKDYILQNEVYTIRSGNTLAGYYSIVYLEDDMKVSDIVLEKGFWLEHMFILPTFIGQGLGRKLFDHCVKTCQKKDTEKIRILSDPHAKEFYLKMGCEYITEYPSTIAGRTTPYLEYFLHRTDTPQGGISSLTKFV